MSLQIKIISGMILEEPCLIQGDLGSIVASLAFLKCRTRSRVNPMAKAGMGHSHLYRAMEIMRNRNQSFNNNKRMELRF
jgi:hypothetical protein